MTHTTETTDRWIFQDIADYSTAMYKNSKQMSYKEAIEIFRKAIKENIDPEIYVQWLMWNCDIYVDVVQIVVDMQNVYGIDMTSEDIIKLVQEHKEPSHFLV